MQVFRQSRSGTGRLDSIAFRARRVDVVAYPPKEVADVQVLTQRMEALDRKLAERMVVDFVRPEKAKAEAPVEPEPKLAAEIVARDEIAPEAELAAVDAGVLVTVEQAKAIAEPEVDLAALRPPITIAVSKMSKFSNNLAGLEL